RYRTDPARIARILPPGLEPDEVPEVTVDWWLRYPDRGGANLFFPGPYTESGIHVTARYQGHRGMFQVGMPLDQDWGRVAGRENVGLLKKDGILTLRRDGRRVEADLRRRGRLLYRIATTVSDQPAHPVFWHRETGYGAFLYRYRLHPDWRRGPLGLHPPAGEDHSDAHDAEAPDDPVELWLRVLGGKTGRYPDRMREGGARACDPAATRFEIVDPSPLDPFAELPLSSIVGVSYFETGLAEVARREPGPRTESRIERLQEIDRHAFEPWAFYAYDRPITAGRAWKPAGWPERSTALKLTTAELERYRRRTTLELEVRRWLDLELSLDPSLHRRTLPPALHAGAEPRLRVVALDLGVTDVSTVPFPEVWLFVSGRSEGRAAWYALSHLVGSGGDVVNGRETFGYPSRTASIDWREDGSRLRLTASRLGREVARFTWPAATDPAATPDPISLEVVGLRRHPAYRVMTLHGFREPGPRGELVAQPWTLGGVASRLLSADDVSFDFPADPGPGRIGAPDPWYELAGAAVVRAAAGEGGTLHRRPGRILGPVEDHEPYYLERFDGTMSSTEATSGDVRHTFLVG
ncbi:MAG: acetoacetate decarboxylase family protein, partial [Thermoanaerobaculia bacterium]|nr:acetoacetate decarboxylase family protein [Thermoanaerobaculia bacterium]